MNIIVFGDSIAWGAYDTEKGGWVERLKQHLFDKDCFVYNCSVSGATSSDLVNLNRMSREIGFRCPPRKEKIGIIVAIGINDSAFNKEGRPQTSIAQYIANLQKLLFVTYDRIAIIGITPVDENKSTPVPHDNNLFYKNEEIRKYDEALKKLCFDKHLLFIPVSNLIKREHIDGTHLNIEGHRIVFEKVKDRIKGWWE